MVEKNEKEELREIIRKSEDEFEKKILYIASGALLLSLTLLDRIIKLELSLGIGWLVLGWLCLILCLIMNLISHLISKIHVRKAQSEIFNKIRLNARITNHRKRVCTIEALNWLSAILLIIGISLVLVFASINALH